MVNDNKRRLLDTIKILYYKTDEDHWITTEQIRDEIENMGFERPNRKTIDANINFLIEDMGFNIEKERGTSNRYRWVDRDFEVAELKLLVDAVQSSRFISDKKSKEIIGKLKKLTSNNQAEKLDREVANYSYFKRDSSIILYTVDAINEAIREKKRIAFQMVDYDVNMKEVLRYDGKIHEVSPYALVWNNDYYYMVGFATEHESIRSYRVDRMKNVDILDIDIVKKPAGFKIEKYSSGVFGMFMGEPAEIKLECKPYIMNHLVDRFGKNFKVIEKRDDGSFVADIVVEASPTFYSWVFQFGGDAKIKSPDWACEEFCKLLKSFE